VHPDNGMAFTYPLCGHVDVALRFSDDALLDAAQQHATRASERGRRTPAAVLPPACGGPAYRWREAGVNVARVLDVVRATRTNDHLLMRGLGALLRADMCWQHDEIAEAAVIQLYIALDVSFQMVLQVLREQGVPNPTDLDAGTLIRNQVFNPRTDTGGYFKDWYEARIKTMHPSSRFGVFPDISFEVRVPLVPAPLSSQGQVLAKARSATPAVDPDGEATVSSHGSARLRSLSAVPQARCARNPRRILGGRLSPIFAGCGSSCSTRTRRLRSGAAIGGSFGITGGI
jgi:hypothetical protein